MKYKLRCRACSKILAKSWDRLFCKGCVIALRPLSGRDRAREIIRIRAGRQCDKCKRYWKPGTRRLDVHHLSGLCGKKSRSYDSSKDRSKYRVLHHACHMSIHRHSTGPVKLKGVALSTIAEFILAGMSYDAVAKKYGVSQAAIHFRLNGRQKASR